MAITAAQVKELREMTGAGMMDCKKALTATEGDMDKAVEFLREKGLATAQKKASRVAAEGLCKTLVSDVRRQIEIMKLLRQNSSSSDLLFKKMPEAVDSHGDYADAATDIIAAKGVFDGLLSELKHELIKKTKDVFLPEKDKKAGQKMSLTDAAKEWCDRLDPKSFEQLFSDGTERFLQHLKSMTNDEDLFITRLAKLATGLRLEDWDSKTIKQYSDALARFMKTAKDFHSSVVAETINDTSSYQVTFADEEGTSTTRRFDKVEVSPKGKLLFNQITASLEAMGHSISEQEKRQILMEVLKKLC